MYGFTASIKARLARPSAWAGMIPFAAVREDKCRAGRRCPAFGRRPCPGRETTRSLLGCRAWHDSDPQERSQTIVYVVVSGGTLRDPGGPQCALATGQAVAHLCVRGYDARPCVHSRHVFFVSFFACFVCVLKAACAKALGDVGYEVLGNASCLLVSGFRSKTWKEGRMATRHA